MEINKFSVIVPVYNTQKYLRSCVDSILNQTYSSFELILVDDGSADKSGHICDDYMERYPERILAIHKKNEGLISARRTGLKAAKGEYICFVDSDDYIRTDMLEKVSEIIDRYQSEVVVFGNRWVDMQGNILEMEESPVFEEGIIEKERFFEKVLALRLSSLCYKICKRDLFDVKRDYSQWYNIATAEDLLQSLPVIYKAKKFYYSTERFYYYRQNPESIMHTYRKDQYHELDIVMPLLYQCMVKLGYENDKNVMQFYEMYGGILWTCLYAQFRSDASANEYKPYFKQISGFDYVKKFYQYIQKNNGWNMIKGWKIRLALKLLYFQKWNTLICYIKLWLVLYDLKHNYKKHNLHFFNIDI